MGIKVNGQVGPRVLADGAESELRLTRDAAIAVSDAHPRYAEAATRNFSFAVSTAVGGVAPGTALGTTPPMALWNPPSSGIYLAVISARLGYVSGTIGAGTLAYAYVLQQTTTPSGGTELTTVGTSLSGARSRGRAFQGSTLASTPLILAPGIILNPTLATAAAASIGPAGSVVKDEIAGEFIIPPGAVFVAQGVAAAGTSPLVMIGLTWEEMSL